jgi:hypothetical protein
MVQFCAVVVAEQTLSSRHESASVIGPDGIVVSSALGPRAGVSCPRALDLRDGVLRSVLPIRGSVGDSVGQRCYGPCVRTPVTAWWRPL